MDSGVEVNWLAYFPFPFSVLQKAGHHMEDTLVAAYTALLTGYCIMEDEVSSESETLKCVYLCSFMQTTVKRNVYIPEC